MAIDKKLIFWKKQSTFNAPSSPTDTTGSVLWYSIVFFKDTGQIWTNGTYYNCGIWGTPQTNYVPLTIGGTTYNLSKDGHTHAYLPLAGGILTGQLDLSLVGLSTDNFIKFTNDTQVAKLGIRNPYSAYGLTFVDPSNNYHKIWHEGNSNLNTIDWTVKDLRASNRIFLTATSGGRDILIGNQDSVGVNNPAIIKGVNGAIYLGGGTNWTDGGTFTANMVIQDNGDVSVTNTISANSFVKSGGTSSQFLKANGSVDSNIYRPVAGTWSGSGVPGTREFGFRTNDGAGEVAFKSNNGTMNMIIDGEIYCTDSSHKVWHAGNLNPANFEYEAYLKWGGKDFSGSYGCIDAAMVPFLGANRLAFANAAGITIEYSRDSGMTWIDYGASDAQKLNLTSGAGGAGLNIGKCDSTNKDDGTYQLRITFNTSSCGIYTQLNKFCIYLSTNGSVGVTCTIEGALQASPDSYAIFKNSIPVSGWSGYNIINTSSFTTYGNTPSSQYGRIRFIFRSTGGSTTYNGLTLQNIFGYGGVGWVTPSNMARWGQIYSYDSSQNVTFPAAITANSFNGTATSATKVTSTLTRGSYLTGSNFDGSAATTWAVDATTSNTADKIVARDGSGNFSANIITASLSGNATTANSLTNQSINNTTLNTVTLNPGFYNVENSIPTGLTASFHYIAQFGSYSSGGYRAQLAVPYQNGNNDSMYLRVSTGSTWNSWTKFLTDSNYNTYAPKKDGTGASGTWGISITGNAATATTSTQIAKTVNITDANSAYSDGFLKYYAQVSSPFTNQFPTTNNANGILWVSTHPGSYGHQLGFSSNGEIYRRTNTGTAWTSWKTILDSGNSNLSTVDWSAKNLNISGQVINSTYLQVTTSSGYIQLGPQNSSHCHIYTDRPSFYFNKDILINGNAVWHAGNDGAGSGLDADLLDGVHYQNILERRHSGSSASGTATGWFRIGALIESNADGHNCILKIKRNYNYANNESYVFSISSAYNGGISITQLSGYANSRLIDKVRIDYTNSGVSYIELHIATSTTNNSYGWTTIGQATSYTTWTAVSDTPVGTSYEFTTVNGCKSDRGFTGNLSGNSSSATKLQTSRTIWGQSFNGEGNVSGAITNATTGTFSSTISATTGIFSNLAANYIPKHTAGGLINGLIYDNGSNVGIGITSPSYKLDVSGTFRVNNNYTTTFTGNDINFTRTDGSSYINAGNTLSLGAGGTSGVLNVTNANVATFKELLLADGARIYSAAGAGLGISLFNEPSFNPNYGLMFAQTVYKGAHGAVNGDWATYFTMSTDAGRGWIFTSNAAGSGGNVASISNTGNMSLNGYLQVQGGSSVPGIKSSYYGNIGMYFGDKLQYQSTSGIKEFIMTTRLYNINPANPTYTQYNRVPVILWHGRVTISSSTVTFLTYNSGGISLTGSRLNEGTATITMNAYSGALLPNSYSEYMVIGTGLGTPNTTGSTAYITIPDTYKYANNFRLVISDDSTANNGYAEIMIIKVMDPAYYAS